MKYKPLIGDQMAGSMGGITASHNRGGTYFRQRAIPTNPGSPQQTAIRASVAQLTSLWVTVLTEAQRLAWDLYAELVELPDILGEPRNVGGLGMYVRSNVPRLQAGLDRVDDAPTVYNLGEFTEPTVASVDAAADELELGFTTGDAWVDEDGAAMLVLASRGQNPSINYFKGPYRFAASIDGDSGTPPTSPATIALPFAVAAGQRVFVQIRVTRGDGRLSAPFRDFGTAS